MYSHLCGFYVLRDLQEPHPTTPLSCKGFDHIIHCFIATQQCTVWALKHTFFPLPAIACSGLLQGLSQSQECKVNASLVLVLCRQFFQTAIYRRYRRDFHVVPVLISPPRLVLDKVVNINILWLRQRSLIYADVDVEDEAQV